MPQIRIIDLDSTANTAVAGPCTAPDMGANAERRLELTAYISAKDVQQAPGVLDVSRLRAPCAFGTRA